MMNVDILAIGVHPDDIELSCSGTILSHIAQGKLVGLCDLTQGELGTRGNATLRLEEAENARKMMGAKFRVNVGMADGFFDHSKENLIKIIEVIRACTPDVVLANAILDRHPDHGRAAKLIADACYLSGLRKIETTFEGKSQNHWRPKAIYHYTQDYHIEPDIVVDISNFIDQKMELILAFKSQFFNADSNEPSSPISSQGFLDSVKSKNRMAGRPAGFEYGEGFTSAKYIGVKNLFDLF